MIDYYWYVKDFTVVAVNLSHQSILDTDSKAIQQIEFVYKIDRELRAQILAVLEKEKETVLEFAKGTVKVY